MTHELIAIFQENGIVLDYDRASPGEPVTVAGRPLYDNFKAEGFRALFYFGFVAKGRWHPSVLFLHDISSSFIKAIAASPAIELTRRAPEPSSEEILSLLHCLPFILGIEHINFNRIKKHWYELAKVFDADIAASPGSVADFLTLHNPSINAAGRVFFHLVESKDESYPFAFMATYSSEDGKAAHLPLKNALMEYGGKDDMILGLLSAVGRAANKSDFISELVEGGEIFSPLKFSTQEAYVFLSEIPLYEESGVLCRIPDWWRKKANTFRTSVKVGQNPPPHVGLDALLEFQPEIFFGEDKISREEIEVLLAQTEGLAFLKGKWVEVDHSKLAAVLEAYHQADAFAKDGGISIAEALQLQMGLGGMVSGDPADDKGVFEISNGQWLNNIINNIVNPENIDNFNAGPDFLAKLRHYQQKGAAWLDMMRQLGFGALLADDMGLGKTVQILALLSHIKQTQAANFKALLIIPASLLGNWSAEIEKFAPTLKYKVVHGSNADIDIDGANLFITTYGMALRLKGLKEHKWDIVILDEAQAIKNPATKQTRAVKDIAASHRIAMTGTPVENRLSDLWSIFDFLNQGLLGTKKEFSDFIKSLEGGEGYARLRNAVSPFILRRLKTDKSVIDDLPDKIEIKDYASLTKKQVVLYNQLVKTLERSLNDDKVQGIARKGMVVAAITKFKQICNHPDQYLGQKEFDAKYSGKFEMLEQICHTIKEKRERVLVFTQFKEMAAPLARYLTNIFEQPGLMLHGGTQVKKRTTLVEQFNDMQNYTPFIVLSLKAGGVGLNLTAANHIIHFDRWWNPAIENQATDRAFRIGQTKNVIVHKFVIKDTIEEKIDLMLEQKQKLADDIITSSGEAWVTEFSNEELMSLFRLGV